MKLLFLLAPFFLYGQNVKSLVNINAPKSFENIHVEKLSSDKNATNLLIFVKNNVRAHKHNKHTETIFVIDGEAVMVIGKEAKSIKAGDFIIIPEKTIHSVKVTSKIPLKVLSVQAPEFLGKDRIFSK